MARFAAVPSPSDVGSPTRRALEQLAGKVADGTIPAGAVADGVITSADFAAEGWLSWTPTFTNFTLGNGKVVAKYVKHGKLVVVRVKILFGTTTSMGTAPTISMPFPGASLSEAESQWCVLQDATGGRYMGFLYASTASSVGIFIPTVSGGNILAAGTVTATLPFGAWAENDYIEFSFAYEAA